MTFTLGDVLLLLLLFVVLAPGLRTYSGGGVRGCCIHGVRGGCRACHRNPPKLKPPQGGSSTAPREAKPDA